MKCLKVAGSEDAFDADPYLCGRVDHRLSYSDLIDRLQNLYPLYPSSFTRLMRKLGWKCEEFFWDNITLAKFWCKQHSVVFEDTFQTLDCFITEYKPDILYLERSAFHFLQPHLRKLLRKKHRCLQKIVGYWGEQFHPKFHREMFTSIDHVFCLDTHLQEQITQQCKYVTVIPMAFEPMDVPKVAKQHDFVFLGVSGYGYEDHQQRYQDLVYLLENTCIEMWLHEPQEMYYQKRCKFYALDALHRLYPFFSRLLFKKSWLKQKLEQYKKGEIVFPHYLKWSKIPLRRKYPKRAFPPLFCYEYFQKIASSHLVFNCHVDNKAHGGNMRTFEVTGIGSCLLTDRESLLQKFFTPNEEIVCYETIEEAAEKARYLLEHPKEREAIAERGKKRVEKEHLFIHRLAKISAILHSF